MSIELPKLSRTIRAHTDLDVPRNFKNRKEDRTAVLVWRSKENKLGVTWGDLINFVQNEKNSEMVQLLGQLRKETRDMIGKEFLKITSEYLFECYIY